MNYTVKKLGSQDFELLIPLMKDAFGMDVDVDYFRWKFLDNPAGEFVGFIALSEDQECAAYYGVIPELYTFSGQDRVIYQSCDTMTHSRHRRKGLFKLLAEHCYDYLRKKNQLFVIGFGGGESTPGFLKFGWKEIFKLHYIFRLGLQAGISNFRNRLFPDKRFSFRPAEINEIIALRDPENGPKIRQKFTPEFLTWRLANPRKQYLIELILEDQTPAGYLIYYFEQNKVFLFDFYLRSGAAVKGLTHRLDQVCRQNSCMGIVTLGQPNSRSSEQLLSNGFLINNLGKGPLAEKIPFIFYAVEEELSALNDETLWEITPVYHDAL